MIVVPTRAASSPAARALVIEGFEVTEVVMEDPFHYGRLTADLWALGKGFVMVEDDVVPWPGAIQAMLDCPKEWCAYEFPRTYVQHEPRSGFTVSMGCTKLTAAILERYSPAFGDLRWDEVNGPIEEALSSETCHLHYPPVAHVKSHVTTLRRGEIV